jgi:hypothetical protein
METAERLRKIGVPEELLRPLIEARDDVTFKGSFSFVEPAGDLDGRGGKDLFVGDIEYEIAFSPGILGLTTDISQEGTTRLSALSGHSGDVLWHKSYGDFVFPISARVGDEAKSGAYIVKGALSLLGPFEQRYLTIDAVSGRGKREWRRRYESIQSSSDATYSTVDAPLSFDLFDGLGSRATDLLIGLGDVIATPAGYVVRTRTVTLDGKDGSQRDHPEQDVGIDWIPSPWPAGDLDGDRRDDYVVPADLGADLGENQQGPAVGGLLNARRGTDGSRIWTRGGYEFDSVAWVYRLGDVLGNRFQDLAVMTVEPGETAFGGWAAYLVDAGTGRPAWRKPGGWPRSPGDITGDGLDDVVTRDVDVRFGKGVVTYHQWAHSGKGNRLWRRSIKSSYEAGLCHTACSAGVGSGWWDVGDVQRDGLQDHVVHHWVDQQPGEDRTFGFVVSGKTGRLLSSGAEEFRALGAAVDGSGTDLADLELQGPNAVLTARRGDTHAPLWRTSMTLDTVFPPRSWPSAAGMRLDDDRCADVVITFSSDAGSIVLVLDGGDGSLKWSRSIRGDIRVLASDATGDRNRAC